MEVSNALAGGMHAFTQVLLVPVIVVLAALVLYAAYNVGSAIAEKFGERRNRGAGLRMPSSRTPGKHGSGAHDGGGQTAGVPTSSAPSQGLSDLMERIDNAPIQQLQATIANSYLSLRQQDAILELLDHASLPADDRIALARRLLDAEQERQDRRLARTDTIAKIGPMFGLMGTLIPLGPGVIALSQGDAATLSSALAIAFDTTVLGLLAAGMASIVSKIRGIWYDSDAAALEAVMTAVLARIEEEQGAAA